jgi:hypothetical protein
VGDIILFIENQIIVADLQFANRELSQFQEIRRGDYTNYSLHKMRRMS